MDKYELASDKLERRMQRSENRKLASNQASKQAREKVHGARIERQERAKEQASKRKQARKKDKQQKASKEQT